MGMVPGLVVDEGADPAQHRRMIGVRRGVPWAPALVLAVLGCATKPAPPASSPPDGHGPPRMATIDEGARDGYRVLRGCRVAGNTIGILGSGGRRFEAPGGDDARMIALRDLLLASLRSSGVVGAVGVGGGCRDPAVALFVTVQNWRAASTAIEVVGGFFRDRDLSEQATVALPPPDASVDRIPETVRAQEGDYGGYRVLRGCPYLMGPRAIGVIRSGVTPSDAGRVDDERLRALVSRLYDHLVRLPALHGVDIGVGIGAGCIGQIPALHVRVEDWTAMDVVIAAVGDFLTHDGIIEEAVLMLGGRAVLV